VTGLVVLVVVVSCIVLVAREVAGPRQPATTATSSRRGPKPLPAPVAAPASEPDPAWPPPTAGPVLLAPPTDLDRLVGAGPTVASTAVALRAPDRDSAPVHRRAGASRGVAEPRPREPRRRARPWAVEGIRWWQRLRSAVLLAIMAVVLGAILAAVIGAAALLTLNLLRSGVT